MSRRASRNAASSMTGDNPKNCDISNPSTNPTSSTTTYEEIMNQNTSSPSEALSTRLVAFRKWLITDAKCTLHPSVCIVNGEATDGTKNAPVLLYGPPNVSTESPGVGSTGDGQCGLIDGDGDRSLWDRTMGCQVRAAKELKKGECMCSFPRSMMITPDILKKSDVGKAALACMERKDGDDNFWDDFLGTAVGVKRNMDKQMLCNGTELLVKILRERKKAEIVIVKAMKQIEKTGIDKCEFKLAPTGSISTRAVLQLFLLQQRFSNEQNPLVYNPEMDTEVSYESALPEGCPETFGPYARTLPSLISLPICWKRNELALLTGCIPGLSVLQEVAAHTLVLSSDLCALIEGGILRRFPELFPNGTITWDSWVWSASCIMSRSFPVSCYLNEGEDSAASLTDGPLPAEVWDDLGVMIPLLDMLNHERDSRQITWARPEKHTSDSISDNGATNGKSGEIHEPCANAEKRVKKGSEVYNDYGSVSNQTLILQYGFAQIGNSLNTITIGWGLKDGVGKTPSPEGYEESALQNTTIKVEDSMHADNPNDDKYLVYESNDPLAINPWWTEKRQLLLEQETLVDETFINDLRKGKSMIVSAYCDGVYDPILLTAAVVASMPPSRVKSHTAEVERLKEEGAEPNFKIFLTKRHQRILRHYLVFFFARKMEKLLLNLSAGLKDHFNNVQLWTKASNGGLQYNETTEYMSWQTFFDSYAYATTMAVEKKYYAMGPDSCVLTLYDGHLRAIQASLDGVLQEDKFTSTVLKQLTDLGFDVSEEESIEEEEEEEEEEKEEENTIVKEEHMELSTDDGLSAESVKMKEEGQTNEEVSDLKLDVEPVKKSGDDSAKEKTDKSTENRSEKPNQDKQNNGKSNGRDGRSRRNRNKGSIGGGSSRPLAIKLHIGNLSYKTLPAELFDYFANLYGKENVLECHIPTERETGKSRGFGFVTMTESMALDALKIERKHEVHGRLLKVAESNTAGSARSSRASLPLIAAVPASASVVISSDRCGTCGYRPKWCTCQTPNLPHPKSGRGPGPPLGPGHHMGPPGPHMGRRGPEWSNGRNNNMHPPAGMRPQDRRDIYRGDFQGDWGRGRTFNRGSRPSYSRSRSPRRRGERTDSYGFDRRYDRRRSRSRSCSRDRDRYREKSRGGRGRRERSRRSRYSRSRSGSWSKSRSQSRSRSRSYGNEPRRSRERPRKGVDDHIHSAQRERSRSGSKPQAKGSEGGENKRDRERDRERKSRSLSRSRSRGRRKRSRKESSRRYNRSRSRSHSISRSRS